MWSETAFSLQHAEFWDAGLQPSKVPFHLLQRKTKQRSLATQVNGQSNFIINYSSGVPSLPEDLFIWPTSTQCLLCSKHCTKIFPIPEERKFAAKGLWLCGVTRNTKGSVWIHLLTQREVQLWLLSFTLGWFANWRPSRVTLKYYLHFLVSLGTGSLFTSQKWGFRCGWSSQNW